MISFPDEICAVTEGSDKTFHLTKLAIQSFITSNKWFNGIVVILTIKDIPLSNNNISIINEIWDRVEVLEIDKRQLVEITAKLSKKNREQVNLIDFLYPFAFDIKSAGTLYFSRKILFQSDSSDLLDRDFITSPIMSNIFPDDNVTKGTADHSMIYIPSSEQSVYTREEIIKDLVTINLFEHNSTAISFNRVLSNKLKMVSNKNMVRSSMYPNNKYKEFIRYHRGISALLMNTFESNSFTFKRINTYWNGINTKFNSINNRPLYKKPIVSVMKRNGRLDDNILNNRKFKDVVELNKLEKPKGIDGYSFIFTFRRSNEDRFNNLITVIQWINNLNIKNKEVIIVEQDKNTKLNLQNIMYKFYDKGSTYPASITHKFVKNQGLFNRSWGFNIGYKMASFDKLIFSDSDVIYDPLEYINGIESLEKFDIVSPSINQIDLNSKVTSNILNMDYIHEIDYHSIGSMSNKRRGLNISSGTIIMSKSIFEKLGYWDERFEGWGGDDDFLTLKIRSSEFSVNEMNVQMLHLYHTREAADGNKHPKYKGNVSMINTFKGSADKSIYYNIDKSLIGNEKKYDIDGR